MITKKTKPAPKGKPMPKTSKMQKPQLGPKAPPPPGFKAY